MGMWLKQSTAVTVKLGPFVDQADGNTEETSLTISQADIRLSKNGGAFAQTNNAAGATHDEKGFYGVPLDATDTNTLGTLCVHVHESGALPVWAYFMIVPANVWDSLFGADRLQVHADEITNNLITAAAINADAITAAKIAADVSTEIRAVASGTADSGTTTTMVDAALTQADTDYWKGMRIVFTSGSIAGQARIITGFTPGTDTITFYPATTQAVSTNTYEIWPGGAVDTVLVDTVAPSEAADLAEAVRDVTLIGAAAGGLGAAISDIKTVTDNLSITVALAVAQYAIESGLTIEQSIRGMYSVLCGNRDTPSEGVARYFSHSGGKARLQSTNTSTTRTIDSRDLTP